VVPLQLLLIDLDAETRTLEDGQGALNRLELLFLMRTLPDLL